MLKTLKNIKHIEMSTEIESKNTTRNSLTATIITTVYAKMDCTNVINHRRLYKPVFQCIAMYDRI